MFTGVVSKIAVHCYFADDSGEHSELRSALVTEGLIASLVMKEFRNVYFAVNYKAKRRLRKKPGNQSYTQKSGPGCCCQCQESLITIDELLHVTVLVGSRLHEA